VRKIVGERGVIYRLARQMGSWDETQETQEIEIEKSISNFKCLEKENFLVVAVYRVGQRMP
jgi:hypothetical protein